MESGKELEKKLIIVNEDTFTGIDIHSKKDLYLAEMAMRYAKKHKIVRSLEIMSVPIVIFAYNRPSHFKRVMIALQNNNVKNKIFLF